MELSLCPEASESKKTRERLFRACDACYRRKTWASGMETTNRPQNRP
ncbi:hypothetical protein IFM46972_05390 [Aspergillus udagawae]|uniref:Uncharacterized protein n=1 Tax=Aspergillus udagawae TaxID=91492 RepID=A0A8H3NSY4_9EURO|nr:hypothetical protein IFM46972_05390 [Aspergillus udagawae]